MKLTKKKLEQLIMEEYVRAVGDAGYFLLINAPLRYVEFLQIYFITK